MLSLNSNGIEAEWRPIVWIKTMGLKNSESRTHSSAGWYRDINIWRWESAHTHTHIHSMRFHFNNNFFRNCSPIEWNQNDILHKHIFLHFYAKKNPFRVYVYCRIKRKIFYYICRTKRKALWTLRVQFNPRAFENARSHANAFAIYLGLAASIATKRKKCSKYAGFRSIVFKRIWYAFKWLGLFGLVCFF